MNKSKTISQRFGIQLSLMGSNPTPTILMFQDQIVSKGSSAQRLWLKFIKNGGLARFLEPSFLAVPQKGNQEYFSAIITFELSII